MLKFSGNNYSKLKDLVVEISAKIKKFYNERLAMILISAIENCALWVYHTGFPTLISGISSTYSYTTHSANWIAINLGPKLVLYVERAYFEGFVPLSRLIISFFLLSVSISALVAGVSVIAFKRLCEQLGRVMYALAAGASATISFCKSVSSSVHDLLRSESFALFYIKLKEMSSNVNGFLCLLITKVGIFLNEKFLYAYISEISYLTYQSTCLLLQQLSVVFKEQSKIFGEQIVYLSAEASKYINSQMPKISSASEQLALYLAVIFKATKQSIIEQSGLLISLVHTIIVAASKLCMQVIGDGHEAILELASLTSKRADDFVDTWAENFVPPTKPESSASNKKKTV
ncbi:hypothetical protein AYI69_g5372 [Smittium culicis]|uniref:Uncharacterized protein n=1 Tax=Smittium culicis TaxID=133412 RepID=A0A1R1Y671_9FUNG|nr:hypothetical protein AYI69_g5372 [Smittium culicis]